MACRLVIEGGFVPDWIRPRPPIAVDRNQDGLFFSLDLDAAKPGRRTLPGGLKDAEPDVTVVIPTIGPVLALSLEGTESVSGRARGSPRNHRRAGAHRRSLRESSHDLSGARVRNSGHVIGASQIQDLIPVAVPGPVGDPVDHGDHALRRNGELRGGAPALPRRPRTPLAARGHRCRSVALRSLRPDASGARRPGPSRASSVPTIRHRGHHSTTTGCSSGCTRSTTAASSTAPGH